MSEQVDTLAERAERTRSHLSELIDNLQHQVSPGELVQQLVGSRAARKSADLGSALVAQVSRNPLACLMIAAGVGWLVYSETTGHAEPRRKQAAARRRSPARKRRAGRKTRA